MRKSGDRHGSCCGGGYVPTRLVALPQAPLRSDDNPKMETIIALQNKLLGFRSEHTEWEAARTVQGPSNIRSPSAYCRLPNSGQSGPEQPTVHTPSDCSRGRIRPDGRLSCICSAQLFMSGSAKIGPRMHGACTPQPMTLPGACMHGLRQWSANGPEPFRPVTAEPLQTGLFGNARSRLPNPWFPDHESQWTA